MDGKNRKIIANLCTIVLLICFVSIAYLILVSINSKEDNLKNMNTSLNSSTNAELNQNSNENTINNNQNSSNNSYNRMPHRTIDVKKPIIYLYPTEETELTVKLGKQENLLYTYPKYEESWNIIAKPNGDLIDCKTGRNLYALYWEGINEKKYNDKMEEGFCVKGIDTVKFLEEKLGILGLSEREANEFIIYWLPQMENNKYNYIRFQTKEEIDENMPLEISKRPDSIIRIMMEFKPLEEYIEIKEQYLITPERKGFVLVEWGGTKIK